MNYDITKLNNIPKNSYVVQPKGVESEDHLVKNRPTTGLRVMADKGIKNIISYVPKGLRGSKNSNFYEFLSIGMIPNVVGSAMLILISNAIVGKLSGADHYYGKRNGLRVGAGVILYAAGKLLGSKLIDKGVKLRTGGTIDLGQYYCSVRNELPEGKNKKGKVSKEFHKVYESNDFIAWHVINKDGEQKGNRYGFYDKVAEKMGYKGKLNAPDQVVQPVIKDIQAKATAAKAISSYIWAALGVALGAQESVGDFMNFCPMHRPLDREIFWKQLPSQTVQVFKSATKSLLKSKMGKALAIGAVASSVFGVLNATSSFKAEKEDKKTSINYKNDYMEF